MDTTSVILMLLGALQIIVFGILGWALLTLIAHGTAIATLTANANNTQQEIDRRFDDIDKKLDTNKSEMNDKFDELKKMLSQILLNRRKTDE